MKTNLKNLFLVPALIAGLALILPERATAISYSVIKNFGGSDGSYVNGDMALSGSTLYGTTWQGGSSDGGTVFKINTDGTGFTVIKSFAGGSDGIRPNGGLTLSGSTLYGTTSYGGSSDFGTVFKIETDGTGFTVIKSFAGGSDGIRPNGGLTISGSTLYGASGATVFKINTDGTGHTVLKSFSVGEGGPSARLTLSGSTLYGTTSYGGSSDFGTVFKINTDGTGFTVLKNFTGSDGIAPLGLTISGSTLYGTTEIGGSSWTGVVRDGLGTVFKINTDGTGFTVLKNFTPGSGGDYPDGNYPRGGLTLSGSTLYGITFGESSSSYGRVFKINTDGTGFACLKNLAVLSDGVSPNTGLTLTGSALYGTTDRGGSSLYGTVFKLDDLDKNLTMAAKNGVVPTLPVGAKFSTFGVPACNSSGEVAFKAMLVSGVGGVTTANNYAIYAGVPNSEVLIVRSADFAPDATGTPTAARFKNFSDPAYNNAGEIAFRGMLTVEGAVTTGNDIGLWSNVGGTMHLVAREGDVAPDTGGATFASFKSFTLPDSGDVVFLGDLTVGTGIPAVSSSSKTGIWAYDASGTLRKVTRTGESVLVSGTSKTLKTVIFLPSVAYSPGQSRNCSTDGGYLVYRATFTDGTTAILGSTYQ